MSNIENKKVIFPNVKDGETFEIGDMEFIKFPNINGQTPVVMKDIAFKSRFGGNNDLRVSDVLKRMENDLRVSDVLKRMEIEILPKIVAVVGEENLCTIKTDLTTLDGLKPYGTAESLISLPTIDFYRTNVSIFDKYNPGCWWWLATPESAQPHDAPDWILCVSPSGCINVNRYDNEGGVRPFCIFESSIFESSEA